MIESNRNLFLVADQDAIQATGHMGAGLGRLIAAQLLEDTPMEAQVRIAEFAHSSTPEMLVVLSSMLENSGFFAQSFGRAEQPRRALILFFRNGERGKRFERKRQAP